MEKSQYIQVSPGVKLHITDVGTGQPIVLIPGWPQSDEIFKFQYERLVTQGFRVIGITLRGFGQSDKPDSDYNFDVFSSDIDAVLDNLNLKDVILCGFSMGGSVAANYLTKFVADRVSKLVLLSANVPRVIRSEDFPFGPSIEGFSNAMSYLAADHVAAVDIYGKLFQVDVNLVPRSIGDWVNKIHLEASKEAMEGGFSALKVLDLRPLIPNIKIPTAIFNAVNDNKAPYEIAELLHESIAGSVLIRFDEGGHWLIFNEQEKLIAELVKFIRDDN